jgi:L-alanine-DL-glutamate epimerase-like enolase superfamily enzyme
VRTKIRRVEAWVETFELREPYLIAYEGIERVENVFLRVETDSLIGFGCAAPDLKVTGESAATVVQAVAQAIEPLFVGADSLARARLLAELERPLREQPSALAAADLALHDLLGKAVEMPLWRLLGGYRERIATSVTIGILGLPETLQAARDRVDAGFRHLKLKGGRNVEDDIRRVLAVRGEVGDGIGLRFDANQGYSVEESLHFVEQTRAARLELIEQPTAREWPDQLGEVTASVELPVMADESLLSARDAFRLAGRGQVDMVNIKLMKVGGIARAQRVDAVARTARLESMIGCMDESALAISGALAFALASPNVEFADLDGHLDLLGDPAAGAVPLIDGQLVGPEGPGLGVELA